MKDHTVRPASSGSQTPQLEVRGLSKSFRTKELSVQVLADIDLTVARGEFLAVMGASGSGKSTLLNCVSGMDRPTAGTVRLAGHDLTELTEAEMSWVRLTLMGFVFQQAHFLDTLSLRDNVLLPLLHAKPRDVEAAARRVDELLERFGLTAVAHHRPAQVSGGGLQRAAVCRALGASPAVIFADEPTGALNSSMSFEVMDAFSEVHRDGATVVMVTHDASCAVRADRVIYLRDGAIAGSRDLGRWRADAPSRREDDLVAWLRGLGF